MCAQSSSASGLATVGTGRVLAVLGPTNTGKTYLAMERMAAHATGMIGFPLRLLARENYDKMVRMKGANVVALVTGEEKIIPPAPRYWVCTVESMPLDRQVAFLCVDEIQLCADDERGHIFTDRLLHARGSEETMFLGSDMIRPLIQKLIPKVEIITRPRFSRLSYGGHKKLTKLPPRSAVTAFSVTEVYQLAEMVRRSRGGTAVVMGALSPRTRNAQVAMYQAGDVDYLVATDAIGMGLNMDVDHVWFARMTKFDGQRPRRLTAPEVAQIGGRAGRHQTDGTFGTTWDCAPLDDDIVQAVENHEFPPLQQLVWRNSDLDTRSVEGLLRTLEARPPSPLLIRARPADDVEALKALSGDGEVMGLTRRPRGVKMLWEVCQVPDFRKTMTDAHTRLLGQLYRHLMAPGGRLPTDFIAGQVQRLDNLTGDIDTLVSRIAHVRTWTYISHRPDWVTDPKHWQALTRGIEDRLSDALHERLTQRFVDKRSAGLVKSLRDGRDLTGFVAADGTVVVEGHPVGALKGLAFDMQADVGEDDHPTLMTAARRALREEIARRVVGVEGAADDQFSLDADGIIRWDGVELARLIPGERLLFPGVRLLRDELLEGAQRDRVRTRLLSYVQKRVAADLAPLVRLSTADLTGPARGVAFQLAEAAGLLPRGDVASLLSGIDRKMMTALERLGVRFGAAHLYLPALIKPRAAAMLGLLWSVRAGLPLPAPLPPPGRISVLRNGADDGLLRAAGYLPLGPRAVRVDMADRLQQAIADRAGDGRLTDLSGLAALVAGSNAEMPAILAALGWRLRKKPPVLEGQQTPPDIWVRRRPEETSALDGAQRGPARVVVDADNPFAALAGLAEKLATPPAPAERKPRRRRKK
ncbi:helicase-related protein [Niveispirillum lacus]|uniref:helicase-related protein n=1 Tax=Niveispirillum lacus TaxID=1981099 RepID=UPI001FE63D2C|nr:helicase-related protein [Niveispirillum lacus]